MGAIPNGDETMIVRSARDIPEVVDGADLEQVINALNVLTNDYNFFVKNVSIDMNFNGQVIENIVFAAGETKTIPHSIGIVPKYRVILRQQGNGVLDDIPSGWNKYSIQMKNNGAVPVTATILVLKE